MNRLLSILGIVSVFSLSAQIDSAAIRFAETITAAELSEHLHIIAADDYEGRETGYLGQRMCEQYMVNYYKANGIPPVKGSYTQKFDVSLDDPKRVSVQQGNQNFSFLEDFYYYPATGDRVIEGDVVFAGYGISDPAYDDLNSLELRDKIALVWNGEPKNKTGKYVISATVEPSIWTKDRNKKKDLAEAAGAKALMVIHEDYDERIKQVGAYFSHMSMSLPREEGEVNMAMPVFHISPSMARALVGDKQYACLEKAKRKRKTRSTTGESVRIAFERRSELLETSNVMAYIEGTDLKDELIVITAHYDHIGIEGDEVYNGADDDGSGTVATMEIAQAFALAKAAGHGPRRSVMIINVSAEEKGLLGSQYYVENPIFPLENTVADLNIDMIGRVDEQHIDDENYVYLIGSDRLSQGLHDVGEQVNETYVGLDLDYTFNAEDDPNRFYYRSDHYNFAKNGVPSVFYFSGVHEDYHQPGDTVDKIMFPKLAKITKFIFYSAWQLANQDERIVVDKE